MYVIATLSVYPHRASLKNMPGIFFKLARCGYTLRVAITYMKFIKFFTFSSQASKQSIRLTVRRGERGGGMIRHIAMVVFWLYVLPGITQLAIAHLQGYMFQILYVFY